MLQRPRTSFFVKLNFYTDSGKSSTRIVERLGTIEDLRSRFWEEDTFEAVRKYIKELTAADKELRRDVTIKLSQDKTIAKGEQHCFNGGYLFLQKVYHELGLDRICRKIGKKHRNKYDLDSILQMLLYTRVLYPGSKLSSLEEAKRFIEQPAADIHQVYRALSLLAEESDVILVHAPKIQRALESPSQRPGVLISQVQSVKDEKVVVFHFSSKHSPLF